MSATSTAATDRIQDATSTSSITPSNPAPNFTTTPSHSTSSIEFLTDVGNMLKAFIGINFIGIAYAFSKAGIIRGVIGLVVIVLLTEHCCSLLVEVADHLYNSLPPTVADEDPFSALGDEDIDLIDDDPHNATSLSEAPLATPNRLAHSQSEITFGDIARQVGGPSAETVIDGAILLTQFGFCVSYLIFLSQTVHDLVGSAGRVSPFVLLPLPILAYVAMLRSIRSLGPFSLLANFALLIGFVSVVTFIAKHFNWTPAQVPLSSFPLFFGQVTAAIEGIGLILPVRGSMKEPKKFPLVLRIALGIITLILAIVGVLGFATFGAGTRSIILLNFGTSPVVLGVKLVLIVGILFTYPLQITPVFDFAERHFGPPKLQTSTELANEPLQEHDDTTSKTVRFAQDDDQHNRDAMSGDTEEHNPSLDDEMEAQEAQGARNEVREEQKYIQSWRVIGLRLVVIALTAVTAVLGGTSFGIFNALMGSIGATVLAYTGPAMLHFLAFRDRLSLAAKIKDILLVMFGIVGGIAGTAASLYEIKLIYSGATTAT